MFHDNDDLRDPAPPTPGAPERAKVAVRAKQIKRNRRLTAAGGALGLVAVMSLGAVALTGGGSGSGTGTSRIEVAGTSVVRDPAVSSTAAPTPTPTTVAPAPESTPAPAVTDTNTQAPAVAEAPAPAPSAFTISGTIPGVPEGVTGTVRLTGANGTFTASFGPGGSFSISGVPAGTYNADYSWSNADGSASQAGVLRNVEISGDVTVTFS
jgi:hypothetical protein